MWHKMWRIPFTLSRLMAPAGTLAALLTLCLTLPAHAEDNRPDDTPVTVVTDAVEEWTAGAGLLYWAYNCYADEFVSTAALQRMPSAGGPRTTIESIDDFARCNTYLNLLSSDDGLYFYDDSGSRIVRMPLGPPYAPATVKELSRAETPLVSRPFVESGDYLYWVHFFGKIFRTLKDGSGPIETVAETGNSPTDVMVIGNTVYWIDSTGVWTIRVNCETRPCTDTKSQFAEFSAGTTGYGLAYRFPASFRENYSVYWVQRTTSGADSTYRIVVRSCGQITLCLFAPPATFYTATTNWLIGPPLLANETLYWTERDVSTVTNSTGDLKRRARSATPADATDTIATNQANIDRRLFVANDTIFFARRSTGIYSLSLTAAPITRDFEATALEVTQAIQNLANAVPLVANKTTYVRAYGKQLSGPNTPNVEVRLAGTRNGNPLPGSPLPPMEGARALVTGAGFDRARLTDGWTFLLPANWIGNGPVALTLEVDGRLLHNDPNRANNELVKTITFQQQPPICVWTVPVRTHTPLPSVNDANFWPMVDHFERRWPVPDVWIFRDTESVEELEVCWWGPVPHPCYGPYELGDGWGVTNGIPDRDKVIVSLWTRALLSFNPDACDDIGAPVHFMGMVHPDADNGGASGYASTISNQSWVQLPPHTPSPAPVGWDMLRAGSVMAQELAHNDGRKHVNCGGPDNVDGNYPYPPCQIGNVGADNHYGFDVTTHQPIRPDQAADFMSYAERTWVSDYTWTALLNSFAAQAANAETVVPAAEGDSVFVTGLVDLANDRGAIAGLLILPTGSVPPATRQAQAIQAAGVNHGDDPHAAFTLRLLDAAGTVLMERTLTLTLLDDHADGESALFSDLFPTPDGTVASVQLLADGAVIDQVSPGTAVPTVSIQAPAAGMQIADSLTIRWQAADADEADRLRFTVQYSHNGGAAWHTIVTDFPDTPDGSYRLTLVDLGSLSGSGPNQARIRILASDGFNTAIATSDAFTVKNRPPDAALLAPQNGATVPAADPIALRGAATDPEEGGLPAAGLVWTVDGNAAGTGADLLVPGLAPGPHTAQLTATDADANTDQATVDFVIAPLDLPLVGATPTLDGICADAPYAQGRGLQLQPYGDGTQATVRLLRTTDHLWACFSGLAQGAALPGAFAGLRVDVNQSGGNQAQPDDVGFFAGENGAVSTLAGDGAGGFANPGPGGLSAQVSAGATTWNAELRIDATVLGGWDHLIGLKAGHDWLTFQGDDYGWPYAAGWNEPATWAATRLGNQPLIRALDPVTRTVGSPPLTLRVTGRDFISGTVVLWDARAVPTTFVDDTQLTAQVGADQLARAGVVAVSVMTAEEVIANSLTFVVEAPTPVITDVTPDAIPAGAAGVELTVNGVNFGADAQVLWNGTPLPTQFVDATRVTAQVDPTRVALGQVAGVAVRTQLPTVKVSNVVAFDVTPEDGASAGFELYLPLLTR